jgi:hypothetical protein
MRTLFLSFLTLSGCPSKTTDSSAPSPFDEPCAEIDPLKQVFWGDLHAHSAWSFDAGAYGSKLTTADGFDYAKGGTVTLPDASGALTRTATIDRPLDFLGMTEHGEFLGEINICTDDSWDGYTSETCTKWRDVEASNGAFDFGVLMASADPSRFEDVCGADGSDCIDAARSRWNEIQTIANNADDRTSECTFTAFVAYEYTNTRDISNLHRNVVFRSDVVPDLPVTHFEAPTPVKLWKGLDEACSGDCDVVVLPHNSNLSNGQLFTPDYEGEDEAEIAALRARMEPVAEIFQHKGDSECRNGFDGIADEAECGFEKLRPPDDSICGDSTGSGGMRLWGCVHRLDFLRNVLLEGLVEEQRIDVNPYQFGLIGSTDTHNGTPGHVDSENFQGHVGVVDATTEGRLGAGTVTHDTLENNPGGLAAVWAEENSRSAIFDAIRRRETYATSGPRIGLRFYGGDALPAGLCGDTERIHTATEAGHPMGSSVGVTATFFVEATADRTPLQQVQIVKGWIDSDGTTHQEVHTIAGDPENGAGVDIDSCTPTGEGSENLCTVWTDPAPIANGFYYARVLENPTCRWSQRECNTYAPGEQPEACATEHIETMVQQRAWSSPIWVGD